MTRELSDEARAALDGAQAKEPAPVADFGRAMRLALGHLNEADVRRIVREELIRHHVIADRSDDV